MPHASAHARAPFLISLCLAALALAAPPIAADDFVDRANAIYAAIRQDKRSDLVILPLLAQMDPTPPGLTTSTQAALLPASAPSFSAAAVWAQAPAQRAVLEALARVTEDEGPETRMVFAQPYGVEAVTPALVGAELYTELGDPPTLAAAKPLYLDKLVDASILSQIEATRLASEGKALEAMEAMLDALFFARQIADRELSVEKRQGMLVMGLALQRLRDLAYTDMLAPQQALTPDALRTIIRRLDDRRGALGIDRMNVPRADRIAAEQLLARVYQPRGGPNPETFSPTLARIATGERPLRLFSEAARWETLRPGQADFLTAQEALSGAYDDWILRWGLADFDPVRLSSTDYTKNVKDNPSYAVLGQILPDIDASLALRQLLRVEAAGTRMSLAMYAYYLLNDQFPRSLSAVRPTFAQTVDADPYSSRGRDIEFYTPVHDRRATAQGETIPYEINIYPGDPHRPFKVHLREDQFVVYSVGPDDDKGWVQFATQADPDAQEGDYLLWPPVLSLLRQHLVEQGRLK